MHSNEASKKRSGHLIADVGYHREVICTVRFSNCEPMDEDDDDRKLPARQEVPCASPPVDEDDDDQKLPAKREVSWEEEEEKEEEEVIPVNRLIDDRGGIDGDSISRCVGDLVDNRVDGVFLHQKPRRSTKMRVVYLAKSDSELEELESDRWPPKRWP